MQVLANPIVISTIISFVTQAISTIGSTLANNRNEAAEEEFYSFKSKKNRSRYHRKMAGKKKKEKTIIDIIKPLAEQSFKGIANLITGNNTLDFLKDIFEKFDGSK